MSQPCSRRGEIMKRTLFGFVLIPVAAFAFTTEPPQSAALPSATDYSATVLPERSDALSWKTLGKVEPSNQDGKLIPVFSKEILALDKKEVKVIGFMVPIEPDAKHKHFVLSAVPPSCPFCMPAGPESMVEVRLKTGIDYEVNPIVVSGKFS